MENCIFCKIAAGEIPANKVYEDDMAMAFYDLNPQAPVHVLIIPKKHYGSILDIEADGAPMNHLCKVARLLAKELGVDEKGFRLVVNTGDDGGQTVHHLHMHLTGGRAFGWPAG
ncbi:Purine nucleoside phosphoramidase [bioreactor metagenome]|uniref:Purine nucleoside phosphoramidase n=1 Tax=bioreactor metagenome TaxID=1076179 RepID=A0A645FVB7_9ZZZZ|nr:histidine triad nucleotide-binding protein [Candidatus Pelethousia sp.]NCB30890.1 histidine triad nucleotide-binding protein [Clostridia bacterium]